MAWMVSVRTSAEAEEAVSELLWQIFQKAVSSFTDTRKSRTTVSAYLNHRRVYNSVLRERIAAGLRRIRDSGLNVAPGTISLAKVRRENWAESWKRHFKPLQIGSTLLVRPSWSRRRPRKDQIVIEIDPGLSFGTGQHPTTAYCLRQLVAARDTGVSQAFLDLGTGSGILAIAAAKLAYRPVDALDLDPAALRIAVRNARQNKVGHLIRFSRQDVRKLPARRRKYALVCANLQGDLLLQERDRIVARIQPGGTLVIAGVLDQEFAAVQHSYEAVGMRLLSSRREKEWRSGTFSRMQR
jgi:ribosomal protein L11 methyltransferase